jgi:hypothetical protein
MAANHGHDLTCLSSMEPPTSWKSFREVWVLSFTHPNAKWQKHSMAKLHAWGMTPGLDTCNHAASYPRTPVVHAQSLSFSLSSLCNPLHLCDKGESRVLSRGGAGFLLLAFSTSSGEELSHFILQPPAIHGSHATKIWDQAPSLAHL